MSSSDALSPNEVNRAILTYIVNNSTDMELWRGAAEFTYDYDIPQLAHIPKYFVELLRKLGIEVDEHAALDDTPRHCFACHETYLERDNAVTACLYFKYPSTVHPSWLTSSGYHHVERFPATRRHCRSVESAQAPMERCCFDWISEGPWPVPNKVRSRARTPVEFRIVMDYYVQSCTPLEFREFLLLAIQNTPSIGTEFLWMFVAMRLLDEEVLRKAADAVGDRERKHCSQCHQEYYEVHNGLGQCVIPGRSRTVGDTRHRNFSFRHDPARSRLSTMPKEGCNDSGCMCIMKTSSGHPCHLPLM